MSFVAAALIGGGAALVGGYMQSRAAGKAADTQAAAARDAAAQQRAMFDIQNAQFAPYRGMGYQGLNLLGQFLPGQTQTYDAQGNVTGTQQGTGYLTQQFTPEQFYQYDPSYKFMREQGLGALTQKMAPAGGGSNIDLARIKFATDYANTAYAGAFDRFQAQQTNLFNRLTGIANIGSGAQTQVANLAQNAATVQGQLGVGAAGAQAGGQIGAANAWSGALQGVGNAATMYGMGKQPTNVPSAYQYTGQYGLNSPQANLATGMYKDGTYTVSY